MLKAKKEELISDVQFEVHKFTDKPKLDPSETLILSCFGEFGCEVLIPLYCLPRILDENPKKYIIAMGWHGRSFLYRHLVDEFWELKEEFQFLRDKCFAFHHRSKNLTKIEKATSSFGKLIDAEYFGRIAVGNQCLQCNHFWGQTENVTYCPKCMNKNIRKSLFSNIKYYKKQMSPLPKPKTIDVAPNSVGIFARNRKTYGRNLQSDFYVKLIKLLKNKGYAPVWLGEKQTTLECPGDILDLRGADLELVLAVVSNLKFTVQFWTASTRLAALMGTPYLLFESPDQLFGNGQEAFRISLTTMGKAKIVLSHFLNVYNDNTAGLALVEESIKEMEQNNWSLKVGMVDSEEAVYDMISKKGSRLTF